MIIKISFPVEGYDNKLHFQDFYFEGEESPTKEQAKNYLVEENNILCSSEDFNMCVNEKGMTIYEEILNYFDEIEEWRMLWSNRLFMITGTNSFVNHPKFGKCAVYWEKIIPFKI